MGYSVFDIVCIYLAAGLTWGAVTLLSERLWRYQCWSAYVKMLLKADVPKRLPHLELVLWFVLVAIWPLDLWQQFYYWLVGYKLKIARLPGDTDPLDAQLSWHEDNPRYRDE